MDFVTPDFGKAPRDDTTFNRKRTSHILSYAQSRKAKFCLFRPTPTVYSIPSITYISTIYCWPK